MVLSVWGQERLCAMLQCMSAPAGMQDHPTAWQGEKDFGLYS